jgi:hypothetical protein
MRGMGLALALLPAMADEFDVVTDLYYINVSKQ